MNPINPFAMSSFRTNPMSVPSNWQNWGSLTAQISNDMNPGGVQGGSFKNIIGSMANQVNSIAERPNALMQESLVNPSIDVHDVMIANAQAEIAINVTSQMVTKAVQAYDRITQIQI